MYTNLTTYDWNRINEIILKMNYEMDILVALKNFLTNVDKLVPYEKASIYFYTLTNDKVNVDTCIENGFNKSDLKRYDEYYCNIDDIVEKMLPTKLKIIRSSDVFDLANRKQTEYYTDYIKPVRTHFSLDSNFRWYKGNEISFGSLDLFRPDRELDFTDKEMAICSILQPHLETKASQYVFSFVDSVNDLLNQYSLTKTENEIARLVLRGYSNEQIAELNYITISTVKKHIASILNKSNTKSRIEFICKINFQGKNND